MKCCMLWTLILLHTISCEASSVVIDVTPSQGKISLGGQASVQCRLQDATNGTSLFWYRRQGNIRYKVGSDYILTLNDGDVGNKRYKLEQVQASDKTYRLTITDAKIEDSATIECRLSTDLSVAADASKGVTVCADTTSTFCDCMATRGWASPDCFTGVLDDSLEDEAESRRKTVVGLIVALCVVVAYSVLIILIWKRDSLKQCCQDDEAEERRRLNASGKSESDDSSQSQHNDPSDSASDSAATCSTSDPSSSGGSEAQGSQTSRQRLCADQMAEGQESWKVKQKPQHQAETSFVTTKAEIHYNQGYKPEADGQPNSIQHYGRNEGQMQQYQAPSVPRLPATYPPVAPLSGHGAIAGQAAYDPQSTYNQPQINTISGSMSGSTMRLGDQAHRSPNDMYSSSQMLHLNRSQSHLDMEGTEI